MRMYNRDFRLIKAGQMIEANQLFTMDSRSSRQAAFNLHNIQQGLAPEPEGLWDDFEIIILCSALAKIIIC